MVDINLCLFFIDRVHIALQYMTQLWIIMTGFEHPRLDEILNCRSSKRTHKFRSKTFTCKTSKSIGNNN